MNKRRRKKATKKREAIFWGQLQSMRETVLNQIDSKVGRAIATSLATRISKMILERGI